MNPVASSPEPRDNARGGAARRPLFPLLGTIAAVGLSILAVSLFPGCGKPPPLIKDDRDANAAKVKPWEAAAARLRKDADAANVKVSLGVLNGDLAAAPETPQPAPLDAKAEETLAALVPLNAEDRAEIRGAVFTSHDPVYLAECLYLRDAARSLETPARPGQTPEQTIADRADLGFAWVCRQVHLNPWMVDYPEGRVTTAIPATHVLRRGSGSGLERMYVFLALLQQMNLDGCLVGAPDAADKPASLFVFSPDKKTLYTGAARGPFWAVGLRIGNDVRLYDPWRGQPFPATLNELKANPDAHKTWFESKDNLSGVTAADARAATVFLAVPVNALAPRIATLEQQLKAEIGATLAIDPVALRNTFADPKPAFWNPPDDRFAYGRTARTFLPVDEGGSDRSPPGLGRLYDAYRISQIPREVFLPPPELRDSEEAASRIQQAVGGVFGIAFVEPPNPRERIQRGKFQDAARDLVSKQDQFAQGLERLRNNRDAEKQVRGWAEKGRDLYTTLGLAATPEARKEAMAVIDEHWARNGSTVQLLIDRISAEVGVVEATFLLALARHEQAEHAQARLERAAPNEVDRLTKEANAAWAAALGEWRTYAERAPMPARLPLRAEHIRKLADRAEKMVQAK